MDYRELFEIAEAQLGKAYVPYSRFHVGAALLTGSGKVYTGVNVENATYGATICAERTASVKAVSEGDMVFNAIAIASSGGTATPCGICRQFLYEFSNDMDVIVGDDADHLVVYKLDELLPHGFRLDK